MKLNIPESTRQRLAAAMIAEPEGYARDDWDGIASEQRDENCRAILKNIMPRYNV